MSILQMTCVFSRNICDCNVFRRQLQSTIDEGQLKFRDHLDTGAYITYSNTPKRCNQS
jgi:hypothetical protein